MNETSYKLDVHLLLDCDLEEVAIHQQQGWGMVPIMDFIELNLLTKMSGFPELHLLK